MITIIPATDGNSVIERTPEKTTIAYPIVAWQHLQGHWALPVTVVNVPGGLTVGKAVCHANGMVSDPSTGLVFTDIQEWENAVDRPGYAKAAKSLPTGEPADLKRERREDRDEGTESANEMPDDLPRAKAIPGKPKGKPQVFTNKSFWREIGDAPEESYSIFEVEGGTEAPAKNDDRYEKIKRDDWQALKKDGIPVNPWPMVDDEPVAEEEDDSSSDDIDDLI